MQPIAFRLMSRRVSLRVCVCVSVCLCVCLGMYAVCGPHENGMR